MNLTVRAASMMGTKYKGLVMNLPVRAASMMGTIRGLVMNPRGSVRGLGRGLVLIPRREASWARGREAVLLPPSRFSMEFTSSRGGLVLLLVALLLKMLV